MKKINLLLVALCGVLIIDSCKKKTEPDPAAGTTTTPTAKADSVKFASTVYTMGTKTAQLQGGKWMIQGNYGTGYQVWIYTGLSSAPTTNMNLTIIAPGTGGTVPALSSTQAYVYINHSSNYDSYWGGTLNITVSGGVTKLGMNGVNLSMTSSSAKFPIYMQMTYP